MGELISTKNKKEAQAGNAWSNILPKSSQASKKKTPQTDANSASLCSKLTAVNADFALIFSPCTEDRQKNDGQKSENYGESVKKETVIGDGDFFP